MRKFLAVLLFVLLALPGQAQEIKVWLPLLSKGDCMLCSNGWQLIEAEESTNYVLNPSAEATGNFTDTANGTVTRSTTYQKYGLYSYRVQTGANGDGLSLDLSTLTNASHFVTARIRGQLPKNLRFILGTGIKTPVLLESIDRYWNLYGVGFNANESNGRTEFRIIQQGNGIGDFYVDGVQVEPLNHWTTYIDGTQEGCTWNGPDHAATSTRSGQSLAGGRPRDFYEDYGFFVEKIVGAGATVQELNVDSYALLPGGEINNIKTIPRDMTIVGKFIAGSEMEIHDNRQALEAVLSTDTFPSNQPVRIRYSKARVQKEISLYYRGGLEGDFGAFYDGFKPEGDSAWVEQYQYTEKAAIQFLATDPFWYEVGESAVSLDTNESAVFRTVAGRLKSTGQWSNLGPPAPGGTYSGVISIAEDATYVYIGGSFDNFDGIANADNIVRYNKQTGVYSAMGTGANNTVDDMVIGPNGYLYIVGSFTSAGGVANTNRVAYWDGSAWNAMGTGAADNVVFAITIGIDGYIYIGGSFTSVGGVANTARIAYWNGSAWNAMGTGADDTVFDLVTGIDGTIYAAGNFTTMGGVSANDIAAWNGSTFSDLGSGITGTIATALTVDSRTGILYLGGEFSAVDGVSANNIALWNGTQWFPLGSGVNNRVFELAIGQDGILYASGSFTSAGGITLADRIARWNGYAWAHLDIDLPGSPNVLRIHPSRYTDAVIRQNYDLYLGFTTTGTGNFAGKVNAENEGNAVVFPRIIYFRDSGTSAVIETLRNERTGKELLFNYSLLDGETLVIDLNPLNKSIESSFFGPRQDAVLANSDFGSWALLKGDNAVTSFVAEAGGVDVTAYMLWRDRYLSYN